MTPTQLSQLLARTIPARMPVLIKGAPGVAKTDIVRQACEAAGVELIVSHPVVDEPIDDTRGCHRYVTTMPSFCPSASCGR